jgi:hydrogenase-4 component E
LTHLLIAFLALTLFPLLAASWRVSLLGLALQGLLLGWMLIRAHEAPSAALLIQFLDLVLLRGIVGPQILYGVLSRQRAPRRNDVIPSNLFSWGFVSALLFVSFRFAGALAAADLPSSIGSSDLPSSLGFATATAALLMGMYVLATQNSMFSQMVGVLRIENAIALWELLLPSHAELPIAVGCSAVFLGTVVVFGRFLRTELQSVTEPPPAEQRPSL